VGRALGSELLGDAASLGFGAGAVGRKLLALGRQLGDLLFQALAQSGRVVDLGLVLLARQRERLLVVVQAGLRFVDFPAPCIEPLSILRQLVVLSIEAFPLLVELLALSRDLLQLLLQLARLARIEAGELGAQTFELLQVGRALGSELLGDPASLGFGSGAVGRKLLALGGQLGGLLFQSLAQGGRVIDLGLALLARQGERLLIVVQRGLRVVDFSAPCIEPLSILRQLLLVAIEAFPLLVEARASLGDLLPLAFQLGDLGFQSLAQGGRVLDLGLMLLARQREGLLLPAKLGLGRVDFGAGGVGFGPGRVDLGPSPLQPLQALGQLLFLTFDLMGERLEVLGGAVLSRLPVFLPGVQVFAQLPELLRPAIQRLDAMLDFPLGMRILLAVSALRFGGPPRVLGQACLRPVDALALRSQKLLHPSTLLAERLGKLIAPVFVRERRRGRFFHGHRPEGKNKGTERRRTHNRANPYPAVAVLGETRHAHLPFLYATAMGRSKRRAGRSG